MVASLRFLARSAIATSRLNTRAPTTAATATLRSCLLQNTCHAPHRRGLHASIPRSTASVEEIPAEQTSAEQPSNSTISPKEALNDPNWRHPRFGFAAADFPHLIYIKLPRLATKDDVKALIARSGFQTAQIFMYYHFETGKPADFCYLKIADESKVGAAIGALSRYTLLGSELEPKKYNSSMSPPTHVPSLVAGWLPSPTSDLDSRVIRPPVTEPPKLLPPLMAEQWVLFTNLPAFDPKIKDARFEMAREFYQNFHQYDVIGITAPREHHSKFNGWCCKILFGNPEDAKAARESHEKGFFMGRAGRARIFRGGPNVHKALWDYRQSLPEGMPDQEVGDLLDEKYRKLYKVKPQDLKRQVDYPTPESAVELKNVDRIEL